jgi:hypothetical protein
LSRRRERVRTRIAATSLLKGSRPLPDGCSLFIYPLKALALNA